MKREEYGETRRSDKHRKECICNFDILIKQSKKKRKYMATNY